MAKNENAQELVLADADQRVSTHLSGASSIAFVETEVAGLGVLTDLTVGKAVDRLAWVSAGLKAIDAERKSIVDPLNSVVRTVNAKFKVVTDRFDTVGRTLRSRIAEYHTMKEREAEAERKKQQKLADQATEKAARKLEKSGQADLAQQVRDTAVTVSVAAPRSVTGAAGAASVRKVWTYEIVDEYAVPRAYCAPDPDRIKNAISTGLREIPGVRIFEKSVVVSR